MNITPETPRNDITIADNIFSAPAPYAEGHVLTPNEAAVLNQTLAENLRNNFAGKVKKAVADAEKEGTELDTGALATAFEEYVVGYEFGVRRTGTSRVTLSPVEKEARNIAKEKVKAALKKKNMSLRDVDAETLNSLTDKVLEKYPAITEQAEKIVAMKSQVAADELDLEV